MNKKEIFKNELELITSKHLQDFISYCLENAPDYFFTMPAVVMANMPFRTPAS